MPRHTAADRIRARQGQPPTPEVPIGLVEPEATTASERIRQRQIPTTSKPTGRQIAGERLLDLVTPPEPGSTLDVPFGFIPEVAEDIFKVAGIVADPFIETFRQQLEHADARFAAVKAGDPNNITDKFGNDISGGLPTFNRNPEELLGDFETRSGGDKLLSTLLFDPLGFPLGGGLGKLGRVAGALQGSAKVTPKAVSASRPLAQLKRAEQAIRDRQVAEPVRKLTTLVEGAKPGIGDTEALRTAELGRKSAVAGGRLRSGTGREAFQSAQSSFGGELPKARFDPPSVGLSSDEIIGLHESIRTSTARQFGIGDERILTRINTDNALTKLLAGDLPQAGEIRLLEEMFGPDLARAVLKKRSTGRKVFDVALDVINLPRAVQTSYDISAPLRQGGVLLYGRPIESSDAFLTMMRSLAKEKNARAVDDAIRGHERFTLAEDAGLFIAERTGVSRSRLAGEEVYTSNLASKIPGVRASERAYTTYLNKLRWDVFNSVYDEWLDAAAKGGKAVSKTELKRLAQFINAASGRGRLPKLLSEGNLGAVMNASFFSPRFQASRIDIFATYAEAIAKGDFRLAKEITRDLVAFFSVNTAIISMISLAGGVAIGQNPFESPSNFGKMLISNVGKNPLSSDLGKALVEGTNSRLDFWAGMQPYARFMAQVTANKVVSAKTGKERDLGQINEFGQERSARKQRETSFIEREVTPRIGTAARFGRSKLSPPAAFGVDISPLGGGKDFLGRPIGTPEESFGEELNSTIGPIAGVTGEVYRRVGPLFAQDIIDAMDDAGLFGGFIAAPGGLGAGVVTIPEEEEKKSSGVPDFAFDN